MPVRRLSVGGVAFVSTLSLLAAGGVATARSHSRGAHGSSKSAPANAKEPSKPEPDETGEDATPEPEAEPKANPKPKFDPKPKSEPRPEPKPEPRLEAPPPAPEVTVGGVPVAAVVPALDVEPANPSEAIVGFSDRLFIRSPGGEVVVFPGGRVQVDGAAFPRQTPKSGAYIRRARVELTGWLGRIFYFDVSAEFAPLPPLGEPAAPSVLPATDNYVALAPFGDRFILQAGLFDAPFTLENRTSDAYTVFIERSMAARSLGAPRNKEVGAMVHGLLADGVFYYSGGVFNGDGPDFRNLDNQPDRSGAWPSLRWRAAKDVPPAVARRIRLVRAAHPGTDVPGPGDAGRRALRHSAVDDRAAAAGTLELREHGTVAAFGGELTIPFGTRFGLRGEGVYKRQQLAETEAPPLPGRDGAGLGRAQRASAYGEMWSGRRRRTHAAGAGAGAAEPDGGAIPARLRGRADACGPRRILKEDLVSTQPTLGDPTRATTRVISGTAGANYWRGSFARISINYVFNTWSGTSETIKALRAQGHSSTSCCFVSPPRSDIRRGMRLLPHDASFFALFEQQGKKTVEGCRAFLEMVEQPGNMETAPSASSRSSTSATRSRTRSSRGCTRPSSRRSTATTSTADHQDGRHHGLRRGRRRPRSRSTGSPR